MERSSAWMSPSKWAAELNFGGLEMLHRLPAGMLTAVCAAESSGDPNAVSGAGACGLFQFMPATVRDPGFGLKGGFDPFNPFEAAPNAAQYLGALLERYNNDPAKALAAYNWGAGNVDNAVKTHGDNWLADAPQETKDYVGKIIPQLTYNENYVETADVQRQRAIKNIQSANQANTQEEPEGFLAVFFAVISNFFESIFSNSNQNEEESNKVKTDIVKGNKSVEGPEEGPGLSAAELAVAGIGLTSSVCEYGTQTSDVCVQGNLPNMDADNALHKGR